MRVSPHGGIAPFPRNASRSPRLLRAFPSKNMRYFPRRLCVGSAQPRGRVLSPLNGTPTDYDFPFRAVSFVRPGVLGVPRPTRTHRSRIASRPRRHRHHLWRHPTDSPTPCVSVAFRAADFYGSPGPSSPLTLFTRLHSRRLLSSSPARSLSLFSTRPTPGLLPPDARIAALYMHRPTEGTSPYNPDQCDGNQDRALAPVRHPSVDFSFRLLYAWAAVDPVAHRPPKSVRGGSQRETRLRAPRFSSSAIRAL